MLMEEGSRDQETEASKLVSQATPGNCVTGNWQQKKVLQVQHFTPISFKLVGSAVNPLGCGEGWGEAVGVSCPVRV